MEVRRAKRRRRNFIRFGMDGARQLIDNQTRVRNEGINREMRWSCYSRSLILHCNSSNLIEDRLFLNVNQKQEFIFLKPLLTSPIRRAATRSARRLFPLRATPWPPSRHNAPRPLADMRYTVWYGIAQLLIGMHCQTRRRYSIDILQKYNRRLKVTVDQKSSELP